VGALLEGMPCPYCGRTFDRQLRKRHLENPALKMLKDARSRARAKNLPFALAIEDIVVPERCPILEVAFVAGTKDQHSLSPTLDRVIPELGYVRGNVRVISHRANAIKWAKSAEHHRRVAETVRDGTAEVHRRIADYIEGKL
jgi:hypothetical protein